MGACASLPKAMREEAMAAPAPEPLPKEESVQADQHNTEEVVKVEKEENKANEVDESKQQALGSLLDDQHEKTAQQPQVEAPAEPKKEEPKPEAKVEEAKLEAEKEEQQEEAKEEAKVEPKKDAKPEQAAAAGNEMKE